MLILPRGSLGINSCIFLIILFSFCFHNSLAQNATTCPIGFDCISEQICTGAPIECTKGTYCPGGFNVGELCPVKKYCDHPSRSLVCPEGSFCRTASIEASKCSPLSACPEGTYKQHRWEFVVAVVGGGILAVLFLYLYDFIGKKVSKTPSENTNTLKDSLEMQNLRTSSTGLRAYDCFDIKFSGLGLVIPTKSGDQTVLTDVSGEFLSGEVSAIMGPSGAGKTSLMNVLCGKVKNTSGTICINGVEQKISHHRKLVGYVPQEDVMLRKLKVKELLRHSARLRLPTDMPESQKMQLVDDVIKLLRLSGVADSVVGDQEKRGISGGERKRVNIGLELVALPKLLFLDEPTTGLDSATSKEIMSLLREIANTGITVVAVIHQPRYEILQMCDKLLLLAKGGKTVFMGQTDQCLEYFTEAGFPCPPLYNPADWYMDVVSGKVVPKKADDTLDSTSTSRKSSDVTISVEHTLSKNIVYDPSLLVDLWKLKCDTQHNNSRQYAPEQAVIAERDTPGFFPQFVAYLFRSFLQHIRNPKGALLEMSYHILTGIAMSTGAMSHEIFQPPIPQNMVVLCPDIIRDRCETEAVQGLGVPITMFFMTMTVGAAGATASIATFGDEKAVFYREASCGINSLAYFLARNVFDLYSIARNTFLVAAFYIALCDPPGTASHWYLGMLFISFAGYGMGYFFSNLLETETASVVTIVAAVSWSVTSGLSPTLTQLEDYGPLQFFWWISYCRWGAEALYVNAVSNWQYLRVDEITRAAGYNPDHFAMDIIMVAVIGIAWRILAYAALRLRNREKQR